MSVQTMAAVWKGSQHGGSALLMMLAIADFSDDKGVAYPAVSTLAEKTRMKPRNAHYLLSELQASGELVIKIAAGPRGTNLYRVALDRLQGVQPVARVHRSAGVQPGAGVQDVAGLHPSADGGALQCANPLHPSAPEPSLNHQEPKRKRAEAALTSFPDGFAISQRVRDWASTRGFTDFLDAHLEHFVGSVKAGGKRYADWDEALMNYVRNDWGDVRKRAGGQGGKRSALNADEQFRGAV